MNHDHLPTNLAPNEASTPRLSIKIVGVGSAGLAVVERLLPLGLDAVEFVAVNTDPVSLAASSVSTRFLLESKLLRGLGTGGDPNVAGSLRRNNCPGSKPYLTVFRPCSLSRGWAGAPARAPAT